MPDLDKVIWNMQVIRTWAACSAITLNDMGRIVETIDDALALLEAQKPKLLALDEVGKTKGIIWLEENGDVCAAKYECLEPKTVFGRMTNVVKFRIMGRCSGCGRDVQNYGKKWRCWSQCPTGKQRKAAKWNA